MQALQTGPLRYAKPARFSKLSKMGATRSDPTVGALGALLRETARARLQGAPAGAGGRAAGPVGAVLAFSEKQRAALEGWEAEFALAFFLS